MAKISKFYRSIISALLALLGFSCRIKDIAAEYGTPSATYIAKGKVVSITDDTPIEGIRAEFKNSYSATSAYTNSQGFFTLSDNTFPVYKQLIELTDISGTFTSMVIEADYSNVTLTGGSGSWYSGRAELDLGIIKMTPE